MKKRGKYHLHAFNYPQQGRRWWYEENYRTDSSIKTLFVFIKLILKYDVVNICKKGI